MASETFMITTIDNPYNPFTNFRDWLMFDNEKGYQTADKLGRIVVDSEEFTEDESNAEVERAIDEMISFDPLPIYVKVKASDYKDGKFLGIFPQKIEGLED